MINKDKKIYAVKEAMEKKNLAALKIALEGLFEYFEIEPATFEIGHVGDKYGEYLDLSFSE